MGITHLDKLFRPGSVALVGASEKTGSIGATLLRNLLEGGFKGRVFPINPHYSSISGRPALPSLRNLEEPVDLAVIAVPIKLVPDVVGECAECGIKTAIIISSGGKETGQAGRDIEEQILRAAAGRVRILGPNCLGVIVPGMNLNATFTPGMPGPGNLGFVSQSGAVCSAILDLSYQEGIGFSHFVSVGSMLDIDFGDMIDYLGRDQSTRSILLYVEQLTNIRKFISGARAVSRIKPIIVLKAGSSPAGARAAASHTGALAGEDAVYDAAFKRAGVVRVRTVEELFDCAELIAKQPRPAGPRMAIVTNGGGPGVMAIDAMARCNIDPAVLSEKVMEELNGFLPPFWSHNNPVDILGGADGERYGGVIDILRREPRLHGLMVILAPQALAGPLEVARILVEKAKGLRFPVFAVWMGGRDMAPAIQYLNDSGIATYSSPERAVRAFSTMVQYSRNLELSREIPPRLERRLHFDRNAVLKIIEGRVHPEGCFLSETEAKSVLRAYGMAVNSTVTADSGEAAVLAAEQFGWPVALKIVSPDISHKTEAGGVKLDLRSAGEVRTAYEQIVDGARRYRPDARIAGVSVQPFLASPDYELLLGVKRDSTFGPVIVFGMGGIYTEIFADRSLGLVPLNRLLIRRLMEETKVYRILRGYRNRPAVDMTVLEEMLLQLSQLAVDIPEICELDMNPVIVKDGRPVAVDARILLKPSAKPSPMHLAISPYPEQFELCTITKSGLKLFIRPIKPEDADLFVELFKTLSVTSVYYRFFSHVKELSPEMLAILTQVDYDRHLALVALDSSGPVEKMLGVARIIGDPDITRTEFSIMVGDPWQGQGVGAQLLLNLLKVTKLQGAREIWGTVLPENTGMLRLGKNYGFSLKFNREDNTYDINIDLSVAELEP